MKDIALSIDIVQANIPLLVSRKSMANLECSLDFKRNVMGFSDLPTVPLKISVGGHLSFGWFPASLSMDSTREIDSTVYPATQCILSGVVDDSARPIKKEEFLEIHKHLGHADVNCIDRLCKLSNLPLNLTDARVWIGECSCGRCDRLPQTPLVNRHVASAPGEVCVVDVNFPKADDIPARPALIMVCPLTRFVSCHFVRDVRPVTLVSTFLTFRVSFLGYPKLILSDLGTSFRGCIWEELCHIYSITMSAAPKECPQQIGACEKQSHLIKIGFQQPGRV